MVLIKKCVTHYKFRGCYFLCFFIDLRLFKAVLVIVHRQMLMDRLMVMDG